jgi:hypothetical protein
VQITVVGNRECGLLELLGSPDQVIDPIRAIEEGIFGMAVEVYEGHREEDSDRRATRQRKLFVDVVV